MHEPLNYNIDALGCHVCHALGRPLVAPSAIQGGMPYDGPEVCLELAGHIVFEPEISHHGETVCYGTLISLRAISHGRKCALSKRL